MTTITDTDASNLTAEFVRSQPPYPFWLATITLTGLAVVGLDGELIDGAYILTPTEAVYVPGWAVLQGSVSLNVVNGVATPVLIACTDCVSPSFTYTIYTRLNTPDGAPGDPPPITGVSIAHTLGTTVDISTLL